MLEEIKDKSKTLRPPNNPEFKVLMKTVSTKYKIPRKQQFSDNEIPNLYLKIETELWLQMLFPPPYTQGLSVIHSAKKDIVLKINLTDSIILFFLILCRYHEFVCPQYSCREDLIL